MTGDEKRKISSLRDLPVDIAPPRDLWRGIEARLADEPRRDGEADAGRTGRGGVRFDGPARRRFPQPDRMRIFAAAAVIAALAVGIWIGRAVLPGPAPGSGSPLSAEAGRVPSDASGLSASNTPDISAGNAGAWRASYLLDSKYTRQRAQLVKGLEARLEALPPESRAKVMKSLQTISDSKRDLEAELGKDPSNVLLQELLVNTYQDEMRVLTALQTGGTSEGI